MPVASGSGQPRYVPPVDERDQGDLPDNLRLVSHRLAKFLRHEAPKLRLGDWVDMETILSELERTHNLKVSRDDLLKVVKTSCSKDVRRFEDWTDPADGKTSVRAANAEHYRTRGSKARGGRRGDHRDDRSDCSDWSYQSGVGSTASRASKASNGWQNRGWQQKGSSYERDYGGSARFPEVVPENAPASSSASWPEQPEQRWGGQSQASPNAFEGTWKSKDGHKARISGKKLVWDVHGEQHPPIEVWIEGKDIWVPDDTSSSPWRRKQQPNHIKGWLSDSGRDITFFDGDVWWRTAEGVAQDEAAAAPAAASASAAENAAEGGDQHAAGGGADGGAASSSAAVPPSAEGGEPWADVRVKRDWDARSSGDDYISLSKGELVSMRPGLVEGWAYGYSLQRQKYGYFPPTYVYADSS